MTTNHSSEKELIKIMLRHPEAFDQIADRAKPELFTSPLSSIVFSAAAAMLAAGEEITFITLTRHMTPGDVMNAGGPAELSALFTEAAIPSMTRQFLYDIEACSIRRTVLGLTEALATVASEGGSIIDIAEKIGALSSTVELPEQGQERIRHVGHYLSKVIDELEDARSGKTKEMPTTGLPLLDYLIDGICPSTYMIIAGKTSGGKTALALQLGRECAFDGGVPSLIITYEMPGTMLTKRVVASDAKVGLKVMKTGKLSDFEFGKFEKTMKRTMESKMHIMENVQEMRVAEMRSVVRGAKRKLGIGLVIIDYLQLVPPTNPKDSRERQVAEISFQLQKMSQELDICVIAMSQINDEGQLRESRAIGHDADVVMIIEGENEEPERDLHIIKNRNGELGKVKLTFDGANQQFIQRDK